MSFEAVSSHQQDTVAPAQKQNKGCTAPVKSANAADLNSGILNSAGGGMYQERAAESTGKAEPKSYRHIVS